MFFSQNGGVWWEDLGVSDSVRRFPVIDADGHVFEPFDMWPSKLAPEFVDRAWKRERQADGTEAVLFYGHPTSMEWTVGTLCTPGGLAADGRLDIDLDTEVDRGVDDPVRRLALMDEQGIAASVLFPTMTLGLDDIPEEDFRRAYARAYNEWIEEFCAADPVRLRWGAVIPTGDVDWAIVEATRCLDAGATTVMLSPIPTPAPEHRTLGDPVLDPFWELLASRTAPVVIHASNPGSPSLRISKLLASRTQWQMGVPFQLQLGVMYLIDGGVLERHRDLRVGFFEGDVGWLPHWLGRLQQTYEKMALVSTVPERTPVEQFRAQCVISGEPADLGLAATAELIGADRVLWASDWPHQDGAWPDPKVILRDRTDLTADDKAAMFCEGPARFYGIDVDELLAHLGPSWSLDVAMADIGPMIDVV